MSNIEKAKTGGCLLIDYANGVAEEPTVRSDCKLCHSPHRMEAEKKFEETNSFKSIYVFLKDKGEDIGYHAVRRHLIHHFQAQEKRMMIREYSENIKDLMQHKYNKEQQLLERIAIMQNKIYTIEALAEGSALEDTIKSADAIKKMSDSISNVEKELDIIREGTKPAIIIVQNLATIIKEEMKLASNDEIKNTLERVFDKLMGSIKDIELEK